MDFFDQRILALLKDGKPRGFTAILDEVGFSHNTLQQHLRRLVEKGLVLKEKDPASGFGRPRFIYHVQPRAAKQVAATLEDPLIDMVTMPFSRLRHVCRFEKGGYCKEKKTFCSPQNCPQIKK
jgi:predicted ArsR family transcriptional regulator